MKNKIKILFFAFFLLSTSINSLYANTTTIRYQSEDRETELDNSMSLGIIKNATSDSLKFRTGASTPICRDLYRAEYDRNDNLVSKKLLETEKILIDFSYKEGTFTCLYKNPDEFGVDQQKAMVYSLANYPFMLGVIEGTKKLSKETSISIPIDIGSVYELFDSKYMPSNIGLIEGYTGYNSWWENIFSNPLRLSTNPYSLYKRAETLGLYIPTEGSSQEQDENFTVSRFVTALITLNTDVVTGVSSNGDIIIDSDIEAKMAILKRDGDLSIKLRQTANKIKGFFGGIFSSEDGAGESDAQATKEYTSADSFARYFDKKLFGLYYNFMNIGWGGVFAYGGLMVLGMIFLYSGSIVGYKFAMFRLNESNRGKDFEFPFSNRLVAIGTVFVMSFLHYPTGTPTSISNNNGHVEEIQLQTTIAKNMIGYLANMGASIADVASNSAIVVYMDYLFKATNTNSYDDIIKNLNSNRRVLVEQAITQSFFKDSCVQPYRVNFDKFGSFQSATSHDDAKWSNIESFDNKEVFFNGEGKISPLLCKKIEANLVVNRQVLETSKATSEKMISNLQKNVTFTPSNVSNTALAQTYVDTQLIGAKTLGWFQASTLPVSHIFMLNSNIINNSYDGLNRSTKGEAVTTSLINQTDNMYSAEGEENLAEVLYDTTNTNAIGSMIYNVVASSFSYQVYNLMPFFGELRKSIEPLVEGASDRVFEIVMAVFPQSKITGLIGGFLDKAKIKSGKDEPLSLKSSLLKRKSAYDVGISLFSHVASFLIAVVLYKLMMSAIFAGLITLLSILKICLYFWDVFIHYFVSPLIVAWKMTIQDKTEKVNGWIVDGFILYVFKPTLIVFSFFMYIISFEILMSVYGLIFDITFSSLDMANSFFEDSSMTTSFIIRASLEGFSDIFIYVIGMIMAYFIILKGDTMILDKFKYKDESDSGMTHQLGEKIQQLAGARIH